MTSSPCSMMLVFDFAPLKLAKSAMASLRLFAFSMDSIAFSTFGSRLSATDSTTLGSAFCSALTLTTFGTLGSAGAVLGSGVVAAGAPRSRAIAIRSRIDSRDISTVSVLGWWIICYSSFQVNNISAEVFHDVFASGVIERSTSQKHATVERLPDAKDFGLAVKRRAAEDFTYLIVRGLDGAVPPDIVAYFAR